MKNNTKIAGKKGIVLNPLKNVAISAVKMPLKLCCDIVANIAGQNRHEFNIYKVLLGKEFGLSDYDQAKQDVETLTSAEGAAESPLEDEMQKFNFIFKEGFFPAMGRRAY